FSEVVPTQSVIKREPRVDAEAILHVGTVAVLGGVAQGIARVLKAIRHIAGEKVVQGCCGYIAIRICGVFESQSSAKILVERMLHAGAPEFEAEFDIVLAR